MAGLFKLSFFRNKRDNQPQSIKRSWADLCERFEKPEIRSKKDGALFSPAVFEPEMRRKENVRELSLLVLDIDHNANLTTLKTQLLKLNVAFSIYSTHSHLRRTTSNPDAEPRFRVCLPLASAIPAKNFPALWQLVHQATGLPLDESAKDCSRMFYTPAIAEKDAPYLFFRQEGAFLDWKEFLLKSFSDNGDLGKEGQKVGRKLIFEFHETRHAELCQRIEAQGNNTGRGTIEMKCPAHKGKGDSSLFYDPKTKAVSCLNKPKCSYYDILAAFDLPNVKLPSREQKESLDEEFENSKIETKPFPVPSENCFYGLAGDFVRLLEPHTESSKMALLAQFLTYFGNIIGRTAYYQVEGDKHFTNLFCVLVGKTAQGRKGTAWGRVKQFFKGIDEHHEDQCLSGGLSSGEGLIYHVRDPLYTQKKIKDTGELEEVLADGGISDKRLLIEESEFAQVLRVQGREGNTLSTCIRNLWDTGTVRNLTKNNPLKTTDAHVSTIGHITGIELCSTLTEVETANGYANRFLYFAVERSKFLPFGGNISANEIGQIQDRIIEAIEFSRQKGLMNFSIPASKLWTSVYVGLETSRYGYLAKITQRASPYVLRLSLIFALLDKSNLIETPHLEAALAVWQYAEDSARYVFGDRLGDQTAERILAALKENQDSGLRRTEIRDLFDRHIKNEKLNAALTLLLENGLAKPETQKTGGRSAEVWFACVISVKNVSSQEKLPDEESYNANNAYNAPEAEEIIKCSNCGLKLDLIEDQGILFCAMGCGSRKVK